MKNEQHTKNRKNNSANIETPMAAFSTGCGIWQGFEPFAGCEGNQARQKSVCPAELAIHDFLNYEFVPLYLEAPRLPEDKGITEGVLNSLSLMSGYLQIQPLDVHDKAYPYNILLAHWHAQKQLANASRCAELHIVSSDNGVVSLATEETAPRTYSLYYIPVLPLYRLLKSRENKTGALLLISVFSYLYNIARIPYYRDLDTYLYYHYEIMEEWLTEDDGGLDKEDIEYNRKALATASHGGDVVGHIIYRTEHLEQFEERIKFAAPDNAFGQACLNVAESAFRLWQDFPDCNLFNHLKDLAHEDDGEDDYYSSYDNTIRVEEYVHFIADTDTGLYDSLQQNIDADPEFSTAGDFLFAKFIAYERLQDHLANLLYGPSQNPKASDAFGMRWTGEVINLVELIYGLNLTGQLNHGNASLNEMVRWAESQFGVKIGVIQRRFAEIQNRKRVASTKFLDQMKDNVKQKIEESAA